MRLNQVVAIITGGSSGFGKDFALRICNAGGKALLVDLNATDGEKICRDLNEKRGMACAKFVRMNVCDMNGLSSLFDTCEDTFQQPANVLINNAGIGELLTFYKPDVPTDWQKVIDINLTAVIRGTQLGLQRMSQLQEGVIINISSAAGLAPVPLGPVYAASKWGVVGFTTSVGQAFENQNIRINAICPATAETKLGREAMQIPSYARMVESMGGIMPASRITDAMVQLVEDSKANGKALMVLPRATKYATHSKL